MRRPAPAGLLTRRVLRHLPWWIVGRSLLGITLGFAYGIAKLGPYGAFVGVGLLLLLPVASGAAAPGTRVTARQQPELHALVARVVARTGLRAPGTIRLTAVPEVAAQARPWRRVLLVGYPLLPHLSEAQLAALVAEQLAILDRRLAWLVVPIHRRWAVWSVLMDERPDLAEKVADLDAVAEPVQAVADAAAISAGGSVQSYVDTLARDPTVTWAFQRFLEDLTLPAWRVLVENLDEVWAGLPLTPDLDSVLDEEGWRLLARGHPTLAPELVGRGELTLPMLRPVDHLTPRPLTRRQRRRLARQAYGSKRVVVRWRRFERVPRKWWLRRAVTELGDLETRVAELLGRPARDAAELAEVLVLRNVELLTIYRRRYREARAKVPESMRSTFPEDPDFDEPIPDPVAPYGAPPRVLAALLERELLRRGWSLEHPGVRGVLLSPAGERIDYFTIVGGTLGEPDVTALRELLREPVPN